MKLKAILHQFLKFTVLTLSLSVSSLGLCDEVQDWAQFKKHFLHQDGRIIDTGQNSSSHSEGQGIGMLLAVHYDDPRSFKRIWTWTQTTLQIRQDKFFAWLWSPQKGIQDQNNASDGEILICWALLRASKKWNDDAYAVSARTILDQLREKLIRQDKRGMIVLPGIEGFEKSEGDVINLSYWVFPALKEFSRFDPSPVWESLIQAGINLLREARFGRWGLPPDWLQLAQPLRPAQGFPARFGYDALRIPLYLIWAGETQPELMDAFQGYWKYFSMSPFLPAWTNLEDDSVNSWNASAGIHGIADIALGKLDREEFMGRPVDGEYYSSVLLLLSKMMLTETSRSQ